MLAEYFTTVAKYHYGLSPSEARSLAMEFTVRNHVHVPENWLRDSTAGQEWLIGLMRRYAQLAIWVPEATSLQQVHQRQIYGQCGEGLQMV